MGTTALDDTINRLAPGRSSRRLTVTRAVPSLAPLIAFVAFAALEETLSRSGLISPTKFPPITSVLAALADEIASGAIIAPLSRTLSTWLVSLAIAFVGAVILGTALGTSRVLRALCDPVIAFLRPIPATALIPLVILAIGANANGATFLAVFGTIWQILPIVVRATATVEPVSRDTARVFGFTAWQRLRWLTLPSMEPYLLTALRIGASAALVILVGTELLVGITGIGRKIALSYDGENMKLMYAYILISGLLGAAANLLLNRVIAQRLAVRGGRPG